MMFSFWAGHARDVRENAVTGPTLAFSGPEDLPAAGLNGLWHSVCFSTGIWGPGGMVLMELQISHSLRFA